MYIFEKVEVGGFNIYKSNQKFGDKHLKCFGVGVTPHNQSTLNIYLKGTFRLYCEDYLQELTEKTSSLEISLKSYPTNKIFTEEVVSEKGLRYCVSRSDGLKWFREKISVKPGQVFDESSLFVLLDEEQCGKIIYLTKNTSTTFDSKVIRCWI